MALKLGSSGPLVTAWTKTMLTRFKSYALGVDGNPIKVDGYFGLDEQKVQREYERRTGQPQDGVVSDQDLAALGVRPTLLTVNGTGVPDPFGPGYPADLGRAVDPQRWYWQPIGYQAAVYPMGDSVQQSGVPELVDQINRHPGKFVLCGYSQGAIVTSTVWRDHILNPQGGLHHRLPDIIGHITYGNPMRAPGIANGNVYAGQPLPKKNNGQTTGGVSGPGCLTAAQTPSWQLDFANDGDIYASAPIGDDPWHKQTQVGHDCTLIYDAVMKFDGHDLIALAREVAAVVFMPWSNVLPLVQAIWLGLVFAGHGTNAPHWRYNIDAALRYLYTLA